MALPHDSPADTSLRLNEPDVLQMATIRQIETSTTSVADPGDTEVVEHGNRGRSSDEGDRPPAASVPRSVSWRLYLSHFLSTWNSRSFEFASVLFLAAIYPGTLRYLSIYAMVRSAAGIVLSTIIGKTIDRKPRLPVLRLSISE